MLNLEFTRENRTDKLYAFYKRVLLAAGHRHAKRWLAAVAFIESSFFLVPPDVMLIPMVLANRSQWWIIALICTIASVIGGVAGYVIGFFLFETLGKFLVEFYSYGDHFEEYNEIYKKWGAWAVFGAGLTPFPYKVITIGSGVAKLDLLIFVLASLLARGLRFFCVAGLLYYFGETIKRVIEKYFGIVTIVLFLILITCFLVAKYIF